MSSEPVSALRPVDALRTGLLTILLNPKSGAFWTSVFASTFPTDAPLWFYGATVLIVAALSIGWHLGIAVVFTSERVQAGYKRLRRRIDALCGVVLVPFGLRLAMSR